MKKKTETSSEELKDLIHKEEIQFDMGGIVRHTKTFYYTEEEVKLIAYKAHCELSLVDPKDVDFERWFNSHKKV